ncbi:MAG: ATP-binding protein [Myxococcales bacterium]
MKTTMWWSGAQQHTEGTARGGLQAKFVRVLLCILLPFSLATLAGVTFIEYQASRQSARDTEHRIEEGIADKARVLTENHALALSGLVAENAFVDVNELVEGAVSRDQDVLYGLFVAVDGRPWAYVSPSTRAAGGHRMVTPGDLSELGLAGGKALSALETQRRVHAFGDEVLEFAAPVLDEGELLGTVRYGFSTRRTHKALELSRDRATRTLLTTLLTMSALTLLGGILGSWFVRRALARVAKPLNALTDAAYAIAAGNRDVRVNVKSGDELEVLASAFNSMQEANQSALEQLEAKTEQALEAARLKSEFLANVSHEIRTPMNGVTGLVKLMLEMPLQGKLRRYVETIDASSSALLTVINDVLDFSKMEAGKYTLHREPFEPRTAIQDVVELHGARAAEKHVELFHRVAADVPRMIQGDVDRFRQVLNNLVGNAVKFTDRGEIFVDVRVESRQDSDVTLHVSVQDTGIGVPERDLQSIFDAFSQVDGSLVRRHGGTGLGLAISKHLVEMMGGAIGVQSELDVGSRFWFTITGHIEQEEERVKEPLPPRKSALLIEANQRLRELIKEHLESWGIVCEALASADPAQPGLDALLHSGRSFDVVITGESARLSELRMLLESLEANARARVPVLAITHSSFTGDYRDAGLSLLGPLHKPLRMSELYNCLQKALCGQVELPSAEAHAKARHKRDSSNKILVVEDNEINRFVAVEQLQDLGYEVDVASDGREALAKVAQRAYLAVLMDCQMPEMDGYTATREIRKREAGTGRHQLIIALTAHAMASERQRVAAAGMDDYLSKPLRGNALERMVARYVPLDAAPTPEHEKPAMTSPILDTPPAAPLAPGGRRSERLMRMCQHELPKQVEDVVSAIEHRDAGNLRAAAHKLKGAALVIEASPLAEVAERLEKAAEQQSLDLCAELQALLRRCLSDVLVALNLELEKYA